LQQPFGTFTALSSHTRHFFASAQGLVGDWSMEFRFVRDPLGIEEERAIEKSDSAPKNINSRSGQVT